MTQTIQITTDIANKLFGSLDGNVKLIESEFSVRINTDLDGIKIVGEESNVNKTATLISKLSELIMGGYEVDRAKVKQSIELINDGFADEVVNLSVDTVAVTARGRRIKCKTLGQRDYVDKIKRNSIVFAIGPAGTGKTYLAVALAVAALKDNEVEKIILTRPAIEAGEKLGFLPGDLQTKVDPYLRPLYDALQDMLGLETFNRHMERGTIEVAPLAYMRGRTLSSAFIILDEAQNTTKEQMKMFLTRMGNNSKIVVTGDETQIDLPYGILSGLKHAAEVLKDIEGIEICRLTHKDVVRHELVQKIVLAYAKEEDMNGYGNAKRK